MLALSVAMAGFNARAGDIPPISGITQPLRDVTLSAPVPGIINTEFFKEGQTVKQGDVILELDRKLEEFDVARRKAVMDQAKSDLDATRVLVANTKSVSKEELQKKEADYQVAAAEYGIASEQLARRQVIAPFAGIISEISLQVGAACSPYEPLVRLVDTTHGFFIGHVEGKSLGSLHVDQPVKIEMEGIAEPVAGRVSYISPVVDAASGLARVKAVFDNPDARIRPGVAAKMIVE